MKRDRVAGETLELSIVLPCLNEAETLGDCIRKAQEAIRKLELSGEIVVADNGSHDGSVEIARTLGARVVPVAVRGYGAALRAGIEAARGTLVVMGDADDTYDFGEIDAFVEKLREGYDLVMGCRLPSGGGTIGPGAMPWRHRWLGNPALSGLGRFFFGCPVTDFHCGLRGFVRDRILALELRTTGMEFASEMVIKATLTGLRITEVPITLHKGGRTRPPHLNTWRDGWRHLRFMLLCSPTWLFFVPGGVLLALGGSGGILLRAPVRVQGIEFDTNTLLVCAMLMLVGFKVVAFGMLAKTFAIAEGLLPEDPRWMRIARGLVVEVGVVIGVVLTLIGVGVLAGSVHSWERHHFGPLSYPQSLRLVIPAVTTIVLGLELIFASFFLGLLGLRRR